MIHADHPEVHRDNHGEKVAFLERHGAASLAHSSANLLAHLEGVYALLEGWGARAAVCDAGLFHSVYGTDIFRDGIITAEVRPVVRNLIGEEAESLVHLFATIARSSLFDAVFEGPPFILESRSGNRVGVTSTRYADLAVLTVANWLEQRPRFPASERGNRAREFDLMRRYLIPAARTALELAYDLAPLGAPPSDRTSTSPEAKAKTWQAESSRIS